MHWPSIALVIVLLAKNCHALLQEQSPAPVGLGGLQAFGTGLGLPASPIPAPGAALHALIDQLCNTAHPMVSKPQVVLSETGLSEDSSWGPGCAWAHPRRFVSLAAVAELDVCDRAMARSHTRTERPPLRDAGSVARNKLQPVPATLPRRPDFSSSSSSSLRSLHILVLGVQDEHRRAPLAERLRPHLHLAILADPRQLLRARMAGPNLIDLDGFLRTQMDSWSDWCLVQTVL